MSTCPSCQKSLPSTPVKFCPECGFAIEGTSARPGWVRDNLDLRTIARRQRNILWLILAQLIAYFSMIGFDVPRYGPMVGLIPVAFYLLTMLAIVIVVMQLMAALRIHIVWRIIAVVLCLAPCVSLLLLLSINSRATSALQAAGLKVGLLGVSDDQVVRLLSAYTCRGCGYSLVGNTSGVCPECGRQI